MLRLTAVGMGNPHCVALMDVDNLDAVDWRRLGRLLETDARFPNRTNVQFARVVSPTRIKARIWERGAGETRASGSSACAVAVAAHVLGQVGTEVSVDMEGGTLEVTLGPALEVTLKGPVEQVGLVDVSLKL